MLKQTRTCTVDGCSKPERARGMCGMHYERQRAHGSVHVAFRRMPERGAPLAFLRSLPMSGMGCVNWPFASNNEGYAQIAIAGKKHLVSRMVCERIHGAPPSSEHVAAHDCNKGHEACIAPWHIVWKTPAENTADMKSAGTFIQGERSRTAKLADSDILEIRRLALSTAHAKIAEAFGVSQTLVSGIVRRVRWAHIP